MDSGKLACRPPSETGTRGSTTFPGYRPKVRRRSYQCIPFPCYGILVDFGITDNTRDHPDIECFSTHRFHSKLSRKEKASERWEPGAQLIWKLSRKQKADESQGHSWIRAVEISLTQGNGTGAGLLDWMVSLCGLMVLNSPHMFKVVCKRPHAPRCPALSVL